MKRALLALAVLAAGCAGAPRIAGLGLPPAAELTEVPFFPDDTDQCGPSALATVLAADGVAVTPADLKPQLYVPGRGGTLQHEMAAAARRHGRVPYPLRPQLRDLLALVASGTPVLVMQNLGLSWWPRWHYAVVVGYDDAAGEVVLRSGLERRERMSLSRFAGSWRRAGHWALAVVAPEMPPTIANPHEWLLAATPFELLGQPKLAAVAYEAATRRWPDAALPWQALANARYAQGDLEGSYRALRQALAREPTAAALNNLAHVLLERGCPDPARAALAEAGRLATGAEREVLLRTRAAVEAYRGPRRACADAYDAPR